ncbi:MULTISPECIES: hypothetical protein [unclassified Acinetobacter]|uniref:hypothetical protein n=1 Tax=Acinetobacter TaxID=469 RepID=UPI0015D1D4E6|nr:MULTISPECIES: hypothetical protein [unclassified Acinetobacter]
MLTVVHLVTFVSAKVTKTIVICKTRHQIFIDLQVAETLEINGVLPQTVANDVVVYPTLLYTAKVFLIPQLSKI